MDGRILPLLYTGTKTSRLTGLAFLSVEHSNKYKNEISPEVLCAMVPELVIHHRLSLFVLSCGWELRRLC